MQSLIKAIRLIMPTLGAEREGAFANPSMHPLQADAWSCQCGIAQGVLRAIAQAAGQTITHLIEHQTAELYVPVGAGQRGESGLVAPDGTPLT